MKNCKDCFNCRIQFRAPRTGRELAEGTFQVFSDEKVKRIWCSLGLWNRDFSSFKQFEASSIPENVAQNCEFFEEDKQ